MSRFSQRWAVLAAAVVLGGLLGTTSGCGPRPGSEAECADSGDCGVSEGELVACVSGDCEDVECLASTDCPLGSYCDLEEGYVCSEGCEGDGDCLSGFSCNEGTCERNSCRSTVLDCDFLEICNQDSGECEEAEGVVCARCDGLFHEFDDNSTFFDPCDDTFLGHRDCGPGAVCGNTGHCLPPCEDNTDCPHGFQCMPLIFNAEVCGGLEFGVQTNPVCLSDQCGQ